MVTVSAPVVRQVREAGGQGGGRAPGERWALDYNVRALVWEGFGLTVTEFLDAWASGALEGEQGPQVRQVLDLLADVVAYPFPGARRLGLPPAQPLYLLPTPAPAVR